MPRRTARPATARRTCPEGRRHARRIARPPPRHPRYAPRGGDRTAAPRRVCRHRGSLACPSWALLLPGDRAEEEAHVGRTLGQPPHEVAVPLVAVGHIDAEGVADLRETTLFVRPDAVQHLEFEGIGA